MDTISSPTSDERNTSGRRRQPLLTWLAILVVTLLLGATGIAVAADNTQSPAPAATDTADPEDKDKDEDRAKDGKAGKSGKLHGHGRSKQLLRGKAGGRVLHGEYVVAAADGKFQTMVAQAGAVTAVSASSISLRSDDGFRATYVINAETRVKARGGSIATIAIGSRGEVLALKQGNALIAQTLHARPPKSAEPPD